MNVAVVHAVAADIYSRDPTEVVYISIIEVVDGKPVRHDNVKPVSEGDCCTDVADLTLYAPDAKGARP